VILITILENGLGLYGRSRAGPFFLGRWRRNNIIGFCSLLVVKRIVSGIALVPQHIVRVIMARAGLGLSEWIVAILGIWLLGSRARGTHLCTAARELGNLLAAEDAEDCDIVGPSLIAYAGALKNLRRY
jgi:hypothetical protein